VDSIDSSAIPPHFMTTSLGGPHAPSGDRQAAAVMRCTSDASQITFGPVVCCAACLLALAALQACGRESTTATNPRSVVSDLVWYVYTPEGDATRHLLTVGDTGYVDMTAMTNNGCVGGSPPCYAEVPGGVVFRSSDSNVVWPIGRNMGVSGGWVVFVGKRAGSAYLSGRVQGFAESTLVVVPTAPLSIDSVRVRERHDLNVPDPRVATVTDSAGNLVSITLPTRYSFETRILAFRAGDSTVYLPMTFTSSDSAFAWPSVNCIGWLTFDWMPCTNGGPGLSSVYGVGPGIATITVTARRQQYSFLVTIQ
jgi:hypothetical protein